MILSRTSQYAISGLLRLAVLPADGYCRIEDLIKDTSAPRYAVAKVFHELAKRGLLVSVRGTGGGFRLAPGTLDLTLMDVIEAVDGRREHPWVGRGGLWLTGQLCPLGHILRPLIEQLDRLLRQTRIGDLARNATAAETGCCPANACERQRGHGHRPTQSGSLPENTHEHE